MRRQHCVLTTKALADVVHHVLIGMASASALAAAETAEEKFAGITAVTPASRSTGTPLTSARRAVTPTVSSMVIAMPMIGSRIRTPGATLGS
jgi:hypothetical protein